MFTVPGLRPGECASDPAADEADLGQLAPDNADNLVARFAQPIFPALLPPDDLSRVVTGPEQPPVLLLAVELDDRPVLRYQKVGAVSRLESHLQLRTRQTRSVHHDPGT